MNALTYEILNAMYWICPMTNRGPAAASGSAVLFEHRNMRLLATARHVLEEGRAHGGMYIRLQEGWQPIIKRVIAEDEEMDITVLDAEFIGGRTPPIRIGGAKTVHGMLGRAVGFPELGAGLSEEEWTEAVGETNGRPLAIGAVVTTTVSMSHQKWQYASGYVNSGFSGGGMWYPEADGKWTLVGIITQKGMVQRQNVIRINGIEHAIQTYEPNGMIRFAKIHEVTHLVDAAMAG